MTIAPGDDWTPSDDELAAVKMGAACGARSVTSLLQAVRDAVEGVVAAYAEARCQGDAVDHPAAWAHTVARRLAARWMRHRARNQALVFESQDELDAVAAPGEAAHDEQVATVRRLLRQGRYVLTARQRVAASFQRLRSYSHSRSARDTSCTCCRIASPIRARNAW